MITVITGLPGNGKTLFTLGLVEKLRQEEAAAGKTRPVYQSGIPDLTLPWLKLDDPATWQDLADGSIVVIDECQRVFPPRKQGASVPPHVQALETHRHHGFDIFLITQHPQLLDIAVRKLGQRHIHLHRPFGREHANVREWEQCVNPEDRAVQGVALKSSFPFPKEHYGWYKSAEIHTVKKRLPWKMFATFVGCLVGIVVLGIFSWKQLRNVDEGEQANARITSKNAFTARSSSVSSGAPRTFDASTLKPTLAPWLWSSPFYDPVVKVQSAPRIQGCFSHRWSDGRLDCKCTTQQGSVAAITRDECMRQLASGLFDPARPDRDDKAYNVARLDARDAAIGASASGTEASEAAPGAAESSRGGT